MLPVLWLALCLPAVILAGDVCKPPPIENGDVIVAVESDDSFVGEYFCQPGFALVGASKAKCKDGEWNSNPPVCTALGKCDQKNLPRVKYARLVMNKEFRGAVWRYKCKKGYKRYGEGKVYCDVDSWSIYAPPICAKSGCDMTAVSDLRYGKYKSYDDALLKFKCDRGTEMVGPKTVWCNGRHWNDTLPSCHKEATTPSLVLMTDLGELAMEDGIVHADSGAPITVLCKGTGGFPEPLISIQIDGVEVNVAQEFKNSFSFTPDNHHQGSVVTCSAKNYIMEEPASQSATLRVLYAPSTVHLTSPSAGVAGEHAVVSCLSDKAFPEPDISFQFSQYVEILDEMIEYHKMEDGSYISAIERTFIIPKDIDMIEVKCQTLDQEVVDTAVIKIQRPCSAPVLNIQEDTFTMNSGETFEVTCEAENGNPEPDVTLFINHQAVGQGTSIAKAEIEATPELNGAIIKCEAGNSVMEQPLSTNKFLEVQFAPEEAHLEAPEEVVEGELITASCLTSPSNPPASVSWNIIKDGEISELIPEVPEQLTFPVEDGTKLITVECKVHHHLATIEKKQDIQVLYGPREVTIDGPTEVESGESIDLTCVASESNPLPEISWKIFMDEIERTEYETTETGLTSSFSLTPDSDAKAVEAHCIVNHVAGDNHAKHQIQVIYPETTIVTSTSTNPTTIIDDTQEVSTYNADVEEATQMDSLEAATENAKIGEYDDNDEYGGVEYEEDENSIESYSDDYSAYDESDEDYNKADSTEVDSVLLESAGAIMGDDYEISHKSRIDLESINADVIEAGDDYTFTHDDETKEDFKEVTSEHYVVGSAKINTDEVKVRISSLEDMDDDTNVKYKIIQTNDVSTEEREDTSDSSDGSDSSYGSMEERSDRFYDERMSSDEARGDDEYVEEDTKDDEDLEKKKEMEKNGGEETEEDKTDTIVKSKTGKILDLKALAQKNSNEKKSEAKSNIHQAKLTDHSSANSLSQSMIQSILIVVVSIQILRAYL